MVRAPRCTSTPLSGRGLERLPAGQRESERRGAADAAVDVERAAQHPHPLADADDAEPAALGCEGQ